MTDPAQPAEPTDSTAQVPSPGIAWVPPHLMAGQYQPPPRRRRAPIVISVAAVLVLLLAGGAYAGLHAWYGWGATEPESAMPAGVIAFARVDLDPGYGQQLQLFNLLSRFPKPDTGDQKSGVEHGLLSMSSLGLDFATDVQPWFADRVGFAAWQDGGQQPVTLVALASKDDAQAAKLLANAQTRRGSARLGYSVHNGYALLAIASHDADVDAEAAGKAAIANPLSDSPRFTQALAPLSGGHPALAYVDLAAAYAANAQSVFGALGGQTRDATPASGPYTGTLALSADAADNGIEVRLVATGLTPPATVDPDARALLDTMPRDSIIAGAFPGISADNPLTGGISGFTDDYFGGGSGTDGFGDDPGYSPTERRTLTDGLMAFLTAKTISFAFTKLGSGQPDGVIAAAARDAAAAAKVAAAVRTHFDGNAGNAAGVDVEQQGDTVRIRLGNPSGGPLADSSLYREAMAGGPSRPGDAFFLDIQRLIGSDANISPADRRQWSPIKAVGFSATRHGSTINGLLRVVIK